MNVVFGYGGGSGDGISSRSAFIFVRAARLRGCMCLLKADVLVWLTKVLPLRQVKLCENVFHRFPLQRSCSHSCLVDGIEGIGGFLRLDTVMWMF